jgi:arylsulfatase A-like enzyme
MLGSPGLETDSTFDESAYEQIPHYLKKTAWDGDEERLSLRAWRAKYAASVRALDRRLTPFLDTLRHRGTLDHTYLILTSDHGEELMEHGGWDHGYSLFEHQLHVPLVIRKPLAKTAGRRLTSLVSLIDLMPTILSLAEIETPAGIQGRDFSPLLARDEPFGVHDASAVFSAGVKNQPHTHAVRTLRHKLVWDVLEDEIHLYDLAYDSGELRALAPHDTPVTSHLRQRLMEHLAELTDRGRLSEETVPMTDEFRERLKSLGYVQ